jgi:hypothetical protein
MAANGHCGDFLSETRGARYGAALFAAQAITDELIQELILVECGEPFESVEPRVMGLLTHLLSELYGIVVARPIREICQSRKEIQ